MRQAPELSSPSPSPSPSPNPDSDVRTIADNVLYIYEAPELELSEENFMRIDMDLATDDDWGRRRATRHAAQRPRHPATCNLHPAPGA